MTRTAGGDGMADAVRIQGISFVASHGVTDEERRGRRRFEVDVDVLVPLARAAASDDLRDTVDYGEVARLVVQCGTERTHRLLESLAGAILAGLADRYPGAGLAVEVKKVAPPTAGTPVFSSVRLFRAAPRAAVKERERAQGRTRARVRERVR